MRRRILLADDSVTIQKVIELTFMDEDYDVKAVSNGDEALAALPDVKPDVVIADVHMPGANGYEVCRRSKEIQPDVPVLLLVGTFEPFDEGQARAAGADSFLKKPFDSQELLQRVQDLISSRPGAVAAAPAFPPPLPPLETGLDAALPPLDLGSFDPAPAFETAAGFAPVAQETDWGSFQLEPEPAPAFSAPEPFEPFPAEAPAPRLDSPFLEEEASPFVLEDDRPVTAYPEEALHVEQLEQVEETAAPPVGEPMFELDSPPPFPVPQVAGFAAWTEEAPPAEPAAPELEPLPWSPEPAPWNPEPAPWNPPPLEMEPEEALAAEPVPEPLPEPVAEAVAEEPPPPPLPVSEPLAAAPQEGNGRLGPLSDEDVDRIARRVVELMGDKAVRDIAWEVIPDLAEVVIRSRLRELEAQVENPAE